MSSDDDIERLLREVESTMSGQGAKPAAQSGEMAKSTSNAKANAKANATDEVAARPGGTTLRTAVVAAIVCGVGVFGFTFFFQWLPIIDNPISSGLGAGVGAFLTALALGVINRRWK